MNTKRLTKLVALVLSLVMCLAVLTACPDKPTETRDTTVTYNTTTSVMPSNWNELTYQDNNDTQILGYISSSFFDYDYKFENDQKYNADGSINKAGIVNGAYTTNYSAATKLEDVTATVDAKWGYSDEQKAEGGYAWKITLRDDLKWHDGTPITAADFEYSMQQTLDPTFMNYRANTYYETLMIKGSYEYFYSGAPIYSPIVPAYDEQGDYSFDWKNTQVYLSPSATNMTLIGGYSLETLVNDYVPTDVAKAALKEISDAKNEFGYTLITEENLDTAMELMGEVVKAFGMDWSTLDDETKEELLMEALFYLSGYGDKVEWDTVGMYAIAEENAIVVCLDKSYSLLNADGTLNYQAAYYMSSLPLVKRDLYESCKIAPANGATLWKSNYNSSLATTASWGPYMLVQFEAGSHFTLKKNPNWYGWNMEQYKGQYNIDTIYTRKVEEFNTQWMGFLAGEYDDSSLQTENVGEYLDSKYVFFSGTTGTFGMQLFSDLEVLADSDNNNGILAIREFRQAFNLSLDRSNIVEEIWPGTAAPCFGLLNNYYYYDIENSPNLADGGVYRNNATAKAGILRAYGYTQAEDGTWSINNLTGLTLDEAYETLTGYNPTLAKEKLKEAIEILEANAEDYGYDATQPITLVYGASADTTKNRDRAKYLQGVIDELAKGTKLEGKFVVEFDASAGSKWSDAFRSGDTQIGFGYGFSGNAFNPFSIIGAFVDPDDSLNYHMYWDTSKVNVTLTLPEGDYDGAGQTVTMSAQNWYFCLNGLAEKKQQNYEYELVKYNLDAGKAPTEVRLMILSKLEELTIEQSYSVMLISDAGGSFLGGQFSHFRPEEDNVFMGFGGLRYMVVNYNNADWADYVKSQGGNLANEYKKSE